MNELLRKKFLLILTLIATVVTLVILFAVNRNSNISKTESESTKDIEFTKNILLNASFEEPGFNHWIKANDFFAGVNLEYSDENYKDGRKSFLISSDEKFFEMSEPVSIFIYQKFENVPFDKKLIFNSFIKTENADAAFISLELYDQRDSLLTVTNTDLIEGTTDWTYYTTWIRTQNENIAYLLVKCALEGKGKVWFDKLELFPVEVAHKYFLKPEKEN